MQHGRCAGAWNMALDAALLDTLIKYDLPAAVRLYEWSSPAISLGRFQLDARQWRDAEPGCELVRRITGGAAVHHGSDLTVCMVGRSAAFGSSERGRAAELFAAAGAPIARALSELGLPACMGAGAAGRGALSGDCFQVVTGADVMHASTCAKLAGLAMRRRGGAFLIQASIPLQHAGASLAGTALRHELVSAFSSALGGPASLCVPLAVECATAARLLAEMFQTPEWTYQGRPR